MSKHLSDHHKVLLDILSCALWKKDFEFPEGFKEWDQILRNAMSHSVLAIVSHYLLSKLEFTAKLPSELRLKLKSFVVNSVIASEKLNDVILLTNDVLVQEGIEPILLKGYGIAQFYPYPALRQCGDIDFYVGVDSYKKSYEVLTSRFGKRNDSDIWQDKHYNLVVNDAELEVHRFCDEHYSSKYHAILQKYSEQGLSVKTEIVSINGSDIKIPETTFNAFYIFYHLFRHFIYGGVGLRQICDWAVFLSKNKESIDRLKLETMLKEMNLSGAWKDFGKLIVRYLGFPEEDFPFYDPMVNDRKVLRIIDRILSEGNFGFERSYYKKRSNSYLLNKFLSFWRQSARFIDLMFLYPSSSFYFMMSFLKTAFSKFLAHE